MRRLARNEIARALVGLVALLGLKAVYASGSAPRAGVKLVSTLSSRELNKEAREALTAGDLGEQARPGRGVAAEARERARASDRYIAAEQLLAMREAGVHRVMLQNLLHDDLAVVEIIGRELAGQVG